MNDWWIVRVKLANGAVVRFAATKDEAEAEEVASLWRGTDSIDVETGENRGPVTVEVKHQKVLQDWSPSQLRR